MTLLTVLFCLMAGIKDLYDQYLSFWWLFPAAGLLVLHWMMAGFSWSLGGLLFCIVMTCFYFVMPGRIGIADVAAFWWMHFMDMPLEIILAIACVIGIVWSRAFEKESVPFLACITVSLFCVNMAGIPLG